MANRVLVVEDHRDSRDAIAAVLREYAFEVESAADGAEGLRLARSFSPHVILLDLVMPGMNGFEFLACAAESGELGASRVVLMTAFTRREGLVHGNRLPEGLRLLTKPFGDQELLSAIAAPR